MSLRITLNASFAALAALALAACGGGGGGVEQPVTIGGRITFDRIGFEAIANAGLNPTAPVRSPARHVVVEAIDASTSAILASTTTNTTGDYTLTVPSNRNLFIRAKAQMLRTGTAPTWNFRVLNNTNGDALYVLDGSAASSGAANSTRDLNAPAGWGTTSYTGTRAAAPFAILDTVYQSKELILIGSANATLAALDLFWSQNNRASPGALCPDTGDIGTSFYIGVPAGNDECSTPAALPSGIYILGDFAAGNGDTDEFDQHVIAHEFGHYFEDRFSRSDSIGGSHSGIDRLDMRVAFGEGWGNAYSGMSLNDPNYRDSQSGVTSDFGFSVEADNNANTPVEGWYSEHSVAEILWDIFDGGSESGDNLALGFAPIFATMTGAQVVQTEALISIFPFAAAMRSANSGSAAAINDLLAGEAISTSSDAFADNETRSGDSSTAVPIYTDLALNSATTVCTSATFGDDNKLGYRRFIRFTLNSGRLVTISASGDPTPPGAVAAIDPDIFVFQRGARVAFGDGVGGTETISQAPLAAGTHIIEVYDFQLTGTNEPRHCMSVSVTG